MDSIGTTTRVGDVLFTERTVVHTGRLAWAPAGTTSLAIRVQHRGGRYLGTVTTWAAAYRLAGLA